MRPEGWLTKRELARRLSVSPRTIDRLDLPHMQVGGQNRYLLSEVEYALRSVPEADDNVVVLRPRREAHGSAA